MTIKDYADYYLERNIRIFPWHKKYDPDAWRIWRIAPKEIYKTLLEEYPWKKAKGLRMLSGYNKERIIVIRKCKWMS